YDIVWFEEPVHSADLVAMEKLAAKSPIPVAMGESENTYFGFRDMAKIGVKHLQPCVIGPSVLDWMKIRDLATDKALDFSSGGYSPISAAFIATAPQSALTEYLIPIVKPSFMDTLRKAPVCEHGHFYLPSEPGLPVQPDWERLEVEGQLKKVTYFHARKTKQKVRC
ncbi:hypothetical protein HQ584_00265, partial [Patescibacteria group bacterium]|nr:hypothetical protein [Patescibacteria group bacterium]